MLHYIEKLLPLQLLLVVAASFLIGLEMEGRKAGGKQFSPGGVRTFPLICLAGFFLGMLGGPGGVAFVAGLVVLGALMALLYRAKVASGSYGITTEVYALVTYLLGGLAAAQLWWLVAALTVLMVLLQEFKAPLEALATRLGGDELVTIVKFVLLTAVILPLMPNAPFTRFALNPQRIWLVVVAVAAVSYAGYILQRLTGPARQNLLLLGLLGGAYSSTVTTVVLSRRAAQPGGVGDARSTAGAILASAGVMNLRLLILVSLFDRTLTSQLIWPLTLAAALGVAVGALVCLAGRGAAAQAAQAEPATAPPVSPLELRTAFAFAAVFVVVLSLTHEAIRLLGDRGLYGLGALSGLAAVDPFVLSLTQKPVSSPGVAALAVVLTASVSHLAKGVYAAVLAGRRAGRPILLLLAGLAAATIAGWAGFVRLGWTLPAG